MSRQAPGEASRVYLVRVVTGYRTSRFARYESRPGVILDYGADGSLVSLEILDASQHVTEADRVEFQVSR